MAPPGGPKRKRGDRSYSHDSSDDRGIRPSPYVPDQTRLAQQNSGNRSDNRNHHSSHQDHRGSSRGARRGRGGRGGHSHDQNSSRPPNPKPTAEQQQQPSLATPGPMSPPASQNPPTVKSPPQQSIATQTPPAVTSAPTPVPPSQPTIPTASLSHYHFFTDDRLERWQTGGRSEVVSDMTEVAKDQDDAKTGRIGQEIIRAGLSGKIEADDAGRILSEILKACANDSDPDYFASLFLDNLSMDAEADSSIPANPRVRTLMASSEISPTLMRENLEDNVLVALGLVRDTFGRVFIRQQTNVLYRQSNYNLLREETEGYSKLITLLFTTASNSPPSGPVVAETFENIKALIGAFDLDAGRVLDVILDTFASLLVKHYRFFVKLLRQTSFWPQQQKIDSLETESQGFTSLPVWAQPGHPRWYADETEKKHTKEQKLQRDMKFWDRAREVGLEAFFELGGRRILSEQDYINQICDAQKSTDPRTVEDREWIKHTRTMPPPGNSVAAQLLGFKLRFYASAARDANDTLPVNLIYLAALLIKIGFISFRDLYPHLFPDDDSMDSVKEKQFKEKEDKERSKMRGGGALNALAKAGALKDDTIPITAARLPESRLPETRAATPSKSEPTASKVDTPVAQEDDGDKEKEQLPEPSDQKVLLLKSLLAIGAIPESLYMIGRFPWLIDAFTDLPEHIHRILNHSLSEISANLAPLQDRKDIGQPAKWIDIDQTGSKKDAVYMNQPPRKVLRWAKLDRDDHEEMIDYRFYWEDWVDNVPICRTVDDVFTLCDTLLNLSGVKIGQDPKLLFKLTRIGKYSLKEDPSPWNRQRWLILLKRILVPALSLVDANTGVINEVWDLLRSYPTTTRYSVYAEWFSGPTSRLPDIKTAFDITKARTRDKLKRMSKENMRQMARSLAKLSYSSPGVSFQMLLDQLQSYENFIDVIVDCARYFTYMGYDVLTWCIINTMGQVGKSRIASDGITTSPWLKSMSQFIGKIFRRYSIMNPFPILRYVLHQLRQNSFTDLSILGDLVTEMAGITKDQDPSETQLLALAGGPLLQTQVLRQIHDRRHECKVSARRLVRTLVDNHLAFPLLISIAQQRQTCTFEPSQTSVKVMAENFDHVNLVFTQYLEMLRYNITVNDFDAMAPDVASLISEYGVDSGVAFTIHRKGITYAMAQYDSAHPVENKSVKPQPVDKSSSTDADVEMGEVEDEKNGTAVNGTDTVDHSGNANDVQMEESKPLGIDGEISESNAPVNRAASTTPDSIVENAPWHPVLHELMDKIRPVLPDGFENSLSVSFFVTFWQLSLSDIIAPTSSYGDEVTKQKSKLDEITKKRTDGTAAGAKKKEQDQKSVQDFMQKMTEEMKAHITTYRRVRSRLDKEKAHWFNEFTAAAKLHTLNSALLEQCFIPRLLMSAIDSLFASKMLFYMHGSGVPGFRTMHLLDRIFERKMIANLTYQSSGREVENFGRFMNEILKELSSWHADRSVYEKKAYGAKRDLHGFAKKFSAEGKPTEFLDYEEFRKLLFKWHRQLHETLKPAIESGEQIRILNSLVVVRFISGHFPAIDWMGNELYHAIDQVREENIKLKKGDLLTVSGSVLPSLRARRKHWMDKQAFCTGDGISKGESSSNMAPSKSPQPSQAETKHLNAEAREFTPVTSDSNVDGRKMSTSGKNEPEDGEVEDTDMAEAQVEDARKTVKPEAEVPPVDERLAAVKNEDVTSRTSKSHSRVASPNRSPAPPEASKESSDRNATQKSSESSNRPPLSREASAAAIAQRIPHKLPDRPEVQTQQRRYGDRLSNNTSKQTSDRPDSRPRSRADQRQDQRQDQRGGDLMQQKLDERQSAPTSRMDNVAASGRSHGSGRLQDREKPRSHPTSPSEHTDRDNRLPPSQATSGNNQPLKSASRPQTPSKPPDSRHYHEHPSSRQPPPQAAPPLDRGQPSSHGRVGPQHPSEEFAPGGSYSRGPPSHHYPPDDHRDRYGRPYPPDREGWHNEQMTRGDYRRDGRPDVQARASSYDYDPRQGYRDYSEQAPSGPRVGRPSRNGQYDGQQNYRDPMQPPASRQNPTGQGAARAFHTDSRPIRQQDPNYGRLNTSNHSLPSSASSRGDRSREGQASQEKKSQDAQEQSQAAPVPQSSTERSEVTHTSAPPTPGDRTAASESGGVHPDRLNQIEPDQPSTSTSFPPSGPRSGNSRGPNTSASAGGRPPSGPSGNADRQRDNRRFSSAHHENSGHYNRPPVSQPSGRSVSGPAPRSADADKDRQQGNLSADQSRTEAANSVQREREEHDRAREQAYRGSQPQGRNGGGDRSMENSHHTRQTRNRTEQRERSRSPQRDDTRNLRSRAEPPQSHHRGSNQSGERNGRDRDHRGPPRDDPQEQRRRHDHGSSRPSGPPQTEINVPQTWDAERGGPRSTRNDGHRDGRDRREHGGNSRHSEGRKRAWEGEDEGGRERMDSGQQHKRPRRSGPA